MALRVVIAGGGTGGHLYPGIAVARELQARVPGSVVSFAGTARGLEQRIVPREGFPLDLLRSGGLKGKSLADLVRGAALVPASLVDAWRIISARAPDLVIGVGGYSSGPVVLIAAVRGVPTMVLEQNAVPGLTNRLLARVVKAAAVTFESSREFFGAKAFVSGNPVRAEFLEQAGSSREAGADDEVRVLVFGGSQGAHAINVAMVEAASRLATTGLQLAITHQTGERDLDLVRTAYHRAGLAARVEAFLFEIDGEMKAADLVICRAGATTLAELTASGRPAILVPLPTATDDHQRKNAEVLARAGAGLVIEERDLSGERLAGTIAQLVADPAQRRQMSEAARKLARPDAAARIADRAEQLGQRAT